MFKESEPLEVSMEELWRFGIPINLRKTFWPFKIQNLLCISKQLYRLNKEQGSKLLQKASERIENCSSINSKRLDTVDEQGSVEIELAEVEENTCNQCKNERMMFDVRVVQQIKDDIDKFFQITKCFEEDTENGSNSILQEKKESLLNVLISFLVYRPDVGYVENMSFLAGIVLVHCEEAEAFICFTNWVHSNYFIKLFRGYL